MKIVLYPPIDEGLKAQIERAAPEAEVAMPDRETVLAEIADAEILFGGHNQELLRAAPKLKWIQSVHAGMDSSLLPEIADRDVVITNASGVHAIQVAEHAWALTMALFRGLHTSFRYQIAHEWKHPPLQDLHGATASIIGFGGIGRQYAERAKGLQMRVLALDVQHGEKPDHVEALWGTGRLDDALRAADVVFLACPETPETKRIIDARALGLMKDTAFLVNTARGSVVDEAALVEALKNRTIAGAALDVFEQEPLPADSPLWDLENVIITPHNAGASPNRHHRTTAFFCQNLRRYLAGQPLLNEVDEALGYPKLERRGPQ